MTNIVPDCWANGKDIVKYLMRERGPTLRNLIEVGGLIFVFFGVPFLNHDTTGRVLRALAGEKVDCSSGEPADKTYPFDVIAVPGAGIDFDSKGLPHPNVFQLQRLQAAAALYTIYGSEILLLDAGPEDTAVTSVKYLQEQVDKISGRTVKLNSGKVSIITNTINTASNMQDLSEVMKSKGMKTAVIVTQDFHTYRTAVLACANGINSEVVSVEHVAGALYPGELPRIIQLNTTPEMQRITFIDKLKTLPAMYDPKGNISIMVKEIVNSSRNQVLQPSVGFNRKVRQSR